MTTLDEAITRLTIKQLNLMIDMDEQQLKNTISVASASTNKSKDAIITYCEYRLDTLNVDAAMVEFTPLNDFGVE